MMALVNISIMSRWNSAVVRTWPVSIFFLMVDRFIGLQPHIAQYLANHYRLLSLSLRDLPLWLMVAYVQGQLLPQPVVQLGYWLLMYRMRRTSLTIYHTDTGIVRFNTYKKRRYRSISQNLDIAVPTTDSSMPNIGLAYWYRR